MELLRTISYVVLIAFCIQQLGVADVARLWNDNVAPQLGLPQATPIAEPEASPSATPSPSPSATPTP